MSTGENAKLAAGTRSSLAKNMRVEAGRMLQRANDYDDLAAKLRDKAAALVRRAERMARRGE